MKGVVRSKRFFFSEKETTAKLKHSVANSKAVLICWVPTHHKKLHGVNKISQKPFLFFAKEHLPVKRNLNHTARHSI